MAQSDRNEPESVANERFLQLISLITSDSTLSDHAILFKVSEATIRNWRLNVPPNLRKRSEVMHVLNIDPSLLGAEHSAWDNLISRVKNGEVRLPKMIPSPDWLLFPEITSRSERSTNARSIIIVTREAHNDTNHSALQTIVRENLIRGVKYLFAIPDFCPNKLALTRYVENLRLSATRASPDAGSAQIMVVPCNNPEETDWDWITEAIFFLRDGLKFEDDISNVDSYCVTESWELLYKESERIMDQYKPINQNTWTVMPLRKQDLYLRLLRRWALTSTWI